MQLSVICAEDAPKNHAGDLHEGIGIDAVRQVRDAHAAGGVRVLAARQGRRGFLRAGASRRCPRWCMSGELDPVTPPAGASNHSTPVECEARRHPGHRPHRRRHGMRPAHHARVHRRRIRRQRLDTVCIDKVRRPPFFVTPAGPDPNRQRVRRKPIGDGRAKAMIRIENLHKRFGEVRAVDGVTFTAADGQVTGLLGPNGAGKTTTLRMLYTLMRPDEGQILVDDVDAVADPQGARLRARRAARPVGPVSAAHGARAHRVLRRAAGHHRRRPAQPHRSPAEDARHDRDRRSPRRRLLARRAHQDRAGPRDRPRPEERAARRADQRPRRDEHARGARDHPPAQGAKATRCCSPAT